MPTQAQHEEYERMRLARRTPEEIAADEERERRAASALEELRSFDKETPMIDAVEQCSAELRRAMRERFDGEESRTAPTEEEARRNLLELVASLMGDLKEEKAKAQQLEEAIQAWVAFAMAMVSLDPGDHTAQSIERLREEDPTGKAAKLISNGIAGFIGIVAAAVRDGDPHGIVKNEEQVK